MTSFEHNEDEQMSSEVLGESSGLFCFVDCLIIPGQTVADPNTIGATNEKGYILSSCVDEFPGLDSVDDW